MNAKGTFNISQGNVETYKALPTATKPTTPIRYNTIPLVTKYVPIISPTISAARYQAHAYNAAPAVNYNYYPTRENSPAQYTLAGDTSNGTAREKSQIPTEPTLDPGENATPTNQSGNNLFSFNYLWLLILAGILLFMLVAISLLKVASSKRKPRIIINKSGNDDISVGVMGNVGASGGLAALPLFNGMKKNRDLGFGNEKPMSKASLFFGDSETHPPIPIPVANSEFKRMQDIHKKLNSNLNHEDISREKKLTTDDIVYPAKAVQSLKVADHLFHDELLANDSRNSYAGSDIIADYEHEDSIEEIHANLIPSMVATAIKPSLEKEIDELIASIPGGNSELASPDQLLDSFSIRTVALKLSSSEFMSLGLPDEQNLQNESYSIKSVEVTSASGALAGAVFGNSTPDLSMNSPVAALVEGPIPTASGFGDIQPTLKPRNPDLFAVERVLMSPAAAILDSHIPESVDVIHEDFFKKSKESIFRIESVEEISVNMEYIQSIEHLEIDIPSSSEIETPRDNFSNEQVVTVSNELSLNQSEAVPYPDPVAEEGTVDFIQSRKTNVALNQDEDSKLEIEEPKNQYEHRNIEFGKNNFAESVGSRLTNSETSSITSSTKMKNMLISYQHKGRLELLHEDGGNLDKLRATTSHVVQVRYYPQRPDEMLMQVGDIIGIESEFTDGWALGQNISQGRKRCVFPLAILTPIKSGPSQAIVKRQGSHFKNVQRAYLDVKVDIPARTTSIQRLSHKNSRRSIGSAFSNDSSKADNDSLKSVSETSVEHNILMPEISDTELFDKHTTTIYSRQNATLLKTNTEVFKSSDGKIQKLVSTTYDDSGAEVENFELYGEAAAAHEKRLKDIQAQHNMILKAKYLKTTVTVTKLHKKRIVRITITVYKAKDASVRRVVSCSRDDKGNVISNSNFETSDAVSYLLETFGSIVTEDDAEYTAVEPGTMEYKILESIKPNAPTLAKEDGIFEDIVEDKETNMYFIREINVRLDSVKDQIVRNVTTVYKTIQDRRIFKVLLSTLNFDGVPLSSQEIEGEIAERFVANGFVISNAE